MARNKDIESIIIKEITVNAIELKTALEIAVKKGENIRGKIENYKGLYELTEVEYWKFMNEVTDDKELMDIAVEVDKIFNDTLN